MNKTLYLGLFLAAVVTTACGGSSAAPTPVVPAVVVPACQSNNTATMTLGNTSLNSTYTVSWDGSTRVTLGPGQTSPVYTEAASVPHTLTFRFSNSTQLACSSSTPTLAQCSSNTFTCKF
jgi:hypothetical protein